MGDSPITFGQVLAMVSGLAAFTAIVTFAWRGGAHAAEVKALRDSTTQTLNSFRATLDELRAFVADFNKTRAEWNGWRGAADQRLASAEGEIERRRDQYHNEIAPKLQRVLALEPRVERLEESRT